MPFSNLKIILERITIDTCTEIVCFGNMQSEKMGKLSISSCLLVIESPRPPSIIKPVGHCTYQQPDLLLQLLSLFGLF